MRNNLSGGGVHVQGCHWSLGQADWQSHSVLSGSLSEVGEKAGRARPEKHFIVTKGAREKK